MSKELLDAIDDLADSLAQVVGNLPSPTVQALLPDGVRKDSNRGKQATSPWLFEVVGLYDLLDSLADAGFNVDVGKLFGGRIQLHEAPGGASECTWFRVRRKDLDTVWWVAHGTKFRHRLAEGTRRGGNTHAPDLALVRSDMQAGDWHVVWMIWDLKHRDAPKPGEAWSEITKSEVALFCKFVNELGVDPRRYSPHDDDLGTIQSALPERFEWHSLLTNGHAPVDTRLQRIEHGYSVVAEYTRRSSVAASPSAAEHKKGR